MQITYEQGVAAVLEYLFAEVRDTHETINYLADYLDGDTVPALNNLSEADWKKLQKVNSSNWEKLFKEQFGFTAKEYVDQQQAMLRASLTEKERVMLRRMEGICTVNFTLDPQTGALGGKFYKRSPKKLAWEPNERNGGGYVSGVSFNEGGWTSEMGWTLAEVQDFLERLGATSKKRPVQKRTASYSLYD